MRIKFGVSVITILFSTLAQGSNFSSFLASAKCGDALLKQLKTLKSQNAWIRQADTDTDTLVLRSPTDQIGEWAEVRLAKNQAPELYSITEKATRTFEFQGDQCAAKESAVAYHQPQPAQNDVPLFTDASLKSILKTKKSGVLYVWSPSMVYSVEFFGKLQKAARDANIEFIPIVDRRVSRKELAELQARHGHAFLSSRKISSVELEMRNMEMHYPSSLVFSNGKLAPNSIIGVMNEADFKRRISFDLDFLKL